MATVFEHRIPDIYAHLERFHAHVLRGMLSYLPFVYNADCCPISIAHNVRRRGGYGLRDPHSTVVSRHGASIF